MEVRTFYKSLISLLLSSYCLISSAAQTGWYVTFSGESGTPINTIYKLSVTDGSILGTVVPTNLGFNELRNMAVGPDGKLYVTNSFKNDSRILVFSKINPDGLTRNFLGNFVTPATSSGLVHPYFLTFNPEGNLYISVQDTNIVFGVYGPTNPQSGRAMPLSSFLQHNYPGGTFAPGTFVPAFTAKIPPVTPVPTSQGGLTGNANNSVRAIAFAANHTLYVADEANNRVAVFDRDSGYLITTISDSHTISPDQLFYRQADNLIYIACPGDNRIETYNPETNTLNTFIHDSARLGHVSGIAFGEDGNFYATDRQAMVIYQYDNAGNFIKIFAGPFTDSPEGLMPLYDTYPTSTD